MRATCIKVLKFSLVFSAAALFPSLIAFQDAAALGHTEPRDGTRWRTYFREAPQHAAVEAVALETFDMGFPLAAQPEPTGFVVAFADPVPGSDVASTPAVDAAVVLPHSVSSRFAFAAPARAEHPPRTETLAFAEPSPQAEPAGATRSAEKSGSTTPRALFLTASTTPAAKDGFPLEIEGLVPAVLEVPDAAAPSSVSEQAAARALGLTEKELARSKKCLAEAVYFEARGEPEQGQYAVAQVVMNRTRTGYYPATVCGVVYENKNRRNACQFSFACDGIPDRIFDRESWAKAQHIAEDVLVNGVYLPEISTATHYHATFVRPRWIRDMIKEEQLGSHIFYRVRNWSGEGV
jgi:spore germination cell wall hydrolase CwlJ-like protein